MNQQKQRAVFIAIGAPAGSAVAGAVLAGDGPKTWYPTLRKSHIVLPLTAFVPVALLYYLMCGTLLYRLLAVVRPSRSRTQALTLLATMMAANEGWNYLLFRRRSTRAGLVGMIGFTLITVALYRALRRLDQPTAQMLLPYLGWLGYDLVWAYELWRLNR